MKKKESSFGLIIKIVVLVVVMVGAVGVIANVVGDVNDTIDGFGGSSTNSTTFTTSTTISPSECQDHEYDKNGICIKCGTACAHSDKATAENGNTYCAECGKLYALKAPGISVSAALISWDAVSDAEGYIVNINGATYKTGNLWYNFTSDEAGEFVVTVQAVNGSIISEKSNPYTFTYYAVTYNANDHGQLVVPSWAVRAGGTYSGTIVPNVGYQLPADITITMGGTTLVSGYTYDRTTGEFMIDNVTGNLYITYDASTGVPGKPTLSLNGTVVSWNPVPGATDYHVRVLGMTTVDLFDKYYEMTATSFDLSFVEFEEEATYSISVWADNEYGFGEASAVEYVYKVIDPAPDLLSAPKASWSSEGVMIWDAVEGADFYTVYVEGSASSGSFRMTYDCRFDLTLFAEELLDFGDAPYIVHVKASGVGYAESAASNHLVYTPSGTVLRKLTTPVIKLV